MNIKDVKSQIDELRVCSKRAAEAREETSAEGLAELDKTKERLLRLVDKASEVSSEALSGIIVSMKSMMETTPPLSAEAMVEVMSEEC